MVVNKGSALPIRRSARLVVLSPTRRVLLFDTEVLTAEDPLRPGTTRFWGTPGGGVEDGETFEEAALRELQEETGITDAPIGPWVWSSDRVLRFSDGRRMRFQERFFLVETRSEVADMSRLFGAEAEWIKGYRWGRLTRSRPAATFSHRGTWRASSLTLPQGRSPARR